MSKIYKRRLPEELIEEAISILKGDYPQVTAELLNSLNSYQYTFISKLLEEGSNKNIKITQIGNYKKNDKDYKGGYGGGEKSSFQKKRN